MKDNGNTPQESVYARLRTLQYLKKGWAEEEGEEISRIALKLAANIFSSLNDIYPLGEPPEVAPQEDGGLIMYWMGPFQAVNVMITPAGKISLVNLSLRSREVDEYDTLEVDEALKFLEDVLKNFSR